MHRSEKAYLQRLLLIVCELQEAAIAVVDEVSGVQLLSYPAVWHVAEASRTTLAQLSSTSLSIC